MVRGAGMVKCVNCGFLAMRNLDNGTLDSANYNARYYGFENTRLVQCAAHVIDISGEFQGYIRGNREIVEIIKLERYCQEYIDWRPGESIKDHREYRERQQFLDWQNKMEEQRTKFEVGQRREDLQWREEQEKKAEVRHLQQLKEARRMHNRELLYLGLGVTIAILLITVLGSGIEAGWIPKWFGLAN